MQIPTWSFLGGWGTTNANEYTLSTHPCNHQGCVCRTPFVICWNLTKQLFGIQYFPCCIEQLIGIILVFFLRLCICTPGCFIVLCCIGTPKFLGVHFKRLKGISNNWMCEMALKLTLFYPSCNNVCYSGLRCCIPGYIFCLIIQENVFFSKTDQWEYFPIWK